LLQDVYRNPDFLPLIDVDKAEIQLNELSKAFQRISGEYDLLDEKREVLDTQYNEVQHEIREILVDSNATQKRLTESLTKMKIYAKKIQRLEAGINEMRDDLLAERDNMSLYVQFLYKMNNAYFGDESGMEEVKLFVKSDNIAHTLSRQELTALLTLKLQTLMDTIRQKQASYETMIDAISLAKNKYMVATQFYKKNLDQLEEQQKNLYELLSYIQQDRAAAQAHIEAIDSSKEHLSAQVDKLKRVTEEKRGVLITQDSNVYKLLNSKDREDSQRYFTWPVFPFETISYTFHDEAYKSIDGDFFEGIRIKVEQGSEVYAPAPGIVYKVFVGR